MKGKILRNFIISTGIWTLAIMALITYASIEWNSIMSVIGILILWFVVNTFILVYFMKKDSNKQ